MSISLETAEKIRTLLWQRQEAIQKAETHADAVSTHTVAVDARHAAESALRALGVDVPTDAKEAAPPLAPPTGEVTDEMVDAAHAAASQSMGDSSTMDRLHLIIAAALAVAPRANIPEPTEEDARNFGEDYIGVPARDIGPATLIDIRNALSDDRTRLRVTMGAS